MTHMEPGFKMAETIWPYLENYSEQVSLDFLRKSPISEWIVLMFVLFESILGREFVNRDKFINSIEYGFNGFGDSSRIDSYFLYDMLDQLDSRALIQPMLSEYLKRWETEQGILTSSSLYWITHAIMYITRMGERPLHFSDQDKVRFDRILDTHVPVLLKKGDYDPMAELLLCKSWETGESLDFYGGAIEILIREVKTKGRIGLHPRRIPENPKEFQIYYHPTIVTLALLENEYSKIESTWPS